MSGKSKKIDFSEISIVWGNRNSMMFARTKTCSEVFSGAALNEPEKLTKL